MNLTDEQLIKAFEIHENGKIRVEHHPFDSMASMNITLSNLYRMFELIREKRENAVRQD